MPDKDNIPWIAQLVYIVLGKWPTRVFAYVAIGYAFLYFTPDVMGKVEEISGGVTDFPFSWGTILLAFLNAFLMVIFLLVGAACLGLIIGIPAVALVRFGINRTNGRKLYAYVHRLESLVPDNSPLKVEVRKLQASVERYKPLDEKRHPYPVLGTYISGTPLKWIAAKIRIRSHDANRDS